MSRLIRFERTGGPEVLQWVDADVPAPAAGEEFAAFRLTGIEGYASMRFMSDGYTTRQPGNPDGRQAWTELEKLASYAASSGRKVKDLLALILTDVEMPEMDGYILTKKIKTDPRFEGVPVIMHSSLSGMSNQQLGRSVGVDEYVAKFEPQRLAEVLRRLITQHAAAVKAN